MPRDGASRIWAHRVSVDQTAFVAISLLMRAQSFDLVVIGVAAKGVSDATLVPVPEVPWSDAAGKSDVVVHRSFETDGTVDWRAESGSIAPLLEARGRAGS